MLVKWRKALNRAHADAESGVENTFFLMVPFVQMNMRWCLANYSCHAVWFEKHSSPSSTDSKVATSLTSITPVPTTLSLCAFPRVFLSLIV